MPTSAQALAQIGKPDYSKIWSPSGTPLPRTPSVSGKNAAPVRVPGPAHPVPPQVSSRPHTDVPHGQATVILNAAPALGAGGSAARAQVVGAEVKAGELPLAIAPLGSSVDAGAAAFASSSTPEPVQVAWADAAQSDAAGHPGALVLLSRDDAVSARSVRVAIDTAKLGLGSDWADRAHLVTLPSCALTSPQVVGCLKQTPVASTYDSKTGRLAGELTLPAADKLSSLAGIHNRPSSSISSAGSVVLAAVGGASSGAGSYSATPLNISQGWEAGGSSGAFTYAYPIQAPPTLGGAAPSVALSYDSASVDGKTSSTNSQASWIGDGWDYSPGFVERSYKSCSDDGITGSGDECWAGPNLTLSLAGHSGELVPNDQSCDSSAAGSFEQSKCAWHLKDDDGSKVEYLTGASNGTFNGSYLKVTDTSGTVYFFGLGHLPDASGNPSAKGPDSQAAWTMPVFSPNPGEPCYDTAKGKASRCNSAWRWNLDYVVDPHGNLTTFSYIPETNYYALGGGQNQGTGSNTSYTRGGVLRSIGYGQLLSDQINANGAFQPASRIDFVSGERCVGNAAVCDPSQRTTAHSSDWPDVPLDQNCGQADTCPVYGPTFWSTQWLKSITTYVRIAGAYQPVDSYAVNHRFVPAQNATEDTRIPWLDSVVRTGQDRQVSASDVPLKPVTFTEELDANRVDGTNLIPARPAYNRPRIQLITTETGSTIGVDYKKADCSRDQGVMPSSADTDVRACFNVKWHRPNDSPDAAPVDDWFLRYPVNFVTVNPNTPGSKSQTTSYSYGPAAWHRNDSPRTKDADRTWDQFRGFASVTAISGNPADGPQSMHSTYYYQGMDGDILSSGTRTANAVGRMSPGVADSDWLSGHVLESDTYLQAGDSTPVSYTVNLSSTPYMTSSHSQTVNGVSFPLSARYTATTATSTTKALKADRTTWRTTSKTTKTDPANDNREISVLDTADGLPDLCSQTKYASGPDPQVRAVPSEAWTVSGANACTTAPAGSNTVSWTRSIYDGLALGQLGVKHDLTATHTIDHYDASGAAQFTTVAVGVYDAYGRPLSTTNPNVTDSAHLTGATTTTAYSSANVGELPTSVTVTSPAPAGASDTGTGRITTTKLDSARALPLAVTDLNGRTTATAYDRLGRLTGVWKPGRTTDQLASQTFSYSIPGVVNNAAVPPTVTTSTLLSTGTAYKTSIQIMDGLGRVVQTQSDPMASAYHGRLITDTSYDSQGRTPQVNSAWYNDDTGPAATLYNTSTQQVPAQTHSLYDGLSRPLTTEFVAYGTVQSSTTTRYPGVDRTDVSPPVGATPTSSLTDSRGRASQLWQYRTPAATGNAADADVTSYAYTAAGQASTRTDATGKNVWTYSYDQRGRQISATDPDTGTTARTYDTAGRLATTTDARKLSLAYTYDLLGRMTGSYNGSVSPANQLTGFTYDTVLKGQPSTSTRYTGGAGGTAYTHSVLAYDAVSYQPTYATTTIPGSDVGLTAPVTYATKATYDPITGAVSSDIRGKVGDLPGEQIFYSYEAYGQLAQFGSASVTFDLGSYYDAYGRPIRTTVNPWGTQIVLTNTYDESTGRPLSQFVDKQTAATGAVQQVTYAYDQTGRLTAIRNIPDNTPASTDLQCFGYDYLNRLTNAWSDTGTLNMLPATSHLVGGQGACTNTTPTSGAQAPNKTTVGGPAPYWQSYGYDVTGNRKQLVQHDIGGNTAADVTTAQTFPTPGTINSQISAGVGTGGPHALLGATVTSGGTQRSTNGQFDEVGNATSVTDGNGTTKLTWNSESKLSSVGKVGVTPTTYIYAADGSQLVRKDPGRTTVTFGNDELIYDTTATPATTTAARYTTVPGGFTLVRQGGKQTWQVADYHGTNSLAFDATSLAETRRFADPFGSPRGIQPSTWAGDHGYVGGTKDDTTGLTNLGAREYQPSTGRFLSPDPLLDLADPQQWNGYAYSNNSPVNLSDASGLMVYDPSSGYAAGTGHQLEEEIVHSDLTVAKHQLAQQWHDYTTKKNACAVGPHARTCVTHQQWDHDRAVENIVGKALLKMVQDATLIIPSVKCTLGGGSGGSDQEDCDTVGAFFSLPEVAPIGRDIAALEEDLASMALRACTRSHSFVAETLVLMSDGESRRIEDVNIGDEVENSSPGETDLEKHRVVAVHRTSTDTDFTLLSVGTDEGSKSLESTSNHPYYDVTTQTWADASDVKVGDQLQRPGGGRVTVLATKSYVKPQLTFDLTIEGIHTYYVLAGTTPVLVHNDDANDVGLSREEYIARLIGGEVAKGPDGQDIRIHMPNVGSSGLDVRGPNGEYVFVGGAAKAKNPAKFGQALKVAKYAADQAGVSAIYYLDEGTPESAIKQAQKVFGAENVHTFSMGC